jgi:HEPN domain-containing protein
MKAATRAWLEFAHRDMEAARALAETPYLSNVVLFHAQQCIEKCFKAVLEERGAEVPRIHSVVKLRALAGAHGFGEISIPSDQLDLIEAVYIDARYPGDLGTLPSRFPTKDDAKIVLHIAERVYDEVSRSFPFGVPG